MIGSILRLTKQANTYLAEYSNEMWILMVDKAVVNRDGSILFKFVNGQEVKV